MTDGIANNTKEITSFKILKEYVKKSSYEDIYSILTELFNLFEKELF